MTTEQIKADRDSFAERVSHLVRLHLDNDEGLYRARCDLVREAIQGHDFDQDGDISWNVADALKEWVTADLLELDRGQQHGQPLGGLAVDIMTHALAWVDWREMARDYISEVKP